MISIQPNPTYTNPQAIVQTPKAGDLQLDIYDISGRLLKHSTHILSKGNNSFEIELDELAKATYFIRFMFNDEIITKKIIKN